jgi:hypothetical protein
MKLTFLTLPVLLAVAIACTDGSRLSAEVDGTSSRSEIKAIVGSYKGVAAIASVCAGVNSFSRTTPTHLLRCMWGQ